MCLIRLRRRTGASDSARRWCLGRLPHRERAGVACPALQRVCRRKALSYVASVADDGGGGGGGGGGDGDEHAV